MAMKDLGGVALITGAATGIGRETAFSFAEAGASGIVFADLDEQGAKDAAAASKAFATDNGFRTLALRVDICDEGSVNRMVKAAMVQFGRIDYAVFSAGIPPDSTLPTISASTAEFDKVMAVHAKGTMLCLRAVSKAMSGQKPLEHTFRDGSRRDVGRGAIVTLGSGVSLAAMPGNMPYITAKHAVLGLTRAAERVALDNARHGIRVNTVCPAWVNTPMVAQTAEKNPALQAMTKANPLKRIAEPQEVADVIVFLCSSGASYVNGAAWMVDGGMGVSVLNGM